MSRHNLPVRQKRKANNLALVGILVLASGGFSYQQYYLRKTLPLIRAELARTEQTGPQFFEQLALPPAATPRGEIKKTTLTGGSRGQWQGTPVGVRYVREWQTPGTIAELQEWYIQRLSADGWERADADRPSEVQTVFRKGKWYLTVGHNVFFGGSDAHVRFDLTLEWRYFHRG